jgi:putative DNA primase/helicase
MARGWRFDPPESVEEAKEAWLKEANPLPAFIGARCEPTGACWLADLYIAFVAWASENGITRPQQKSTFKRNLQSSGVVIGHGSRGDKVKGLRLRPR